MKSNFPHIGLARLCGWFGITRQAYYQNNWEDISRTIEEDLLLREIKEIRKFHPRMGGRKLYVKLEAFILEHSIKLGRDGLFDLLTRNNLLIRKRRRKIQTTNSRHRFKKYPNLIRDFVPTGPNQLWVSDITYLKINTGKYLYISFITDAYSHKIVGHQIAETLEAIESIQALKMALRSLRAERNFQLIHHSDRGIQYCSNSYEKLLKKNGILISMTENGDPLENSIAERINGILKGEYLETYKISNLKQAKNLLRHSVSLYNNDRPHLSIENYTPSHIHNEKSELKVKRLWKNYYRKETTFVKKCQD